MDDPLSARADTQEMELLDNQYLLNHSHAGVSDHTDAN